MSDKFDFTIESLGPCTVKSPIELSTVVGDCTANYVKDSSYVRNAVNVYDTSKDDAMDSTNLLQKAGPREMIYFDPKKVKAAICTCGGLCPGLNDVIRAVVRCLWNRYGVRDILGFRFGYKGFFPDAGFEPIPLNPKNVDEIHKIGGSFLGTSRGGGNRITEVVDYIEKNGINMMFIIGGDGTQKGALSISTEALKRGLECAVIGIPKTVDNDLQFIDRSFGFETAVQRAKEAVAASHMEAISQINGIGLVKLMGRESGFIATATALASHEANFCLIPEVPFELEGEKGFLATLEKRLINHQHAVIIVAEGAGQDLLAKTNQTDASGNTKLADIGVYLRDEINDYFKKKNFHINLKYIDPSYQVRASVTTASDSIYCERLGNNAVHAAMAGKTKMVVGLVHDKFVHIPISMAVAHRNVVDPEGALWRDTLDATGQPILMVNDVKAAKEKMAKTVKDIKENK
ncbi:MAG: ATP-dependent 6-phosphofructokinase [Treponema sp.]|nr:ATP-dependent 6-phosphofructokinase [Treponema sp.]MBQ5631785.1 ATP-dependent 6-phosphofructokinase [Treponema sp.]MBQ5633246.1 ATP-dependent 6-phosphofructokinase [Treponema sp.]MBQ5647277.1 ATP-dependent 6-phosphofructokinase [Treponema sp.]MBQ5848669.1 ATP-dependent 6-phosphofructokinase [Treponema sp.]